MAIVNFSCGYIRVEFDNEPRIGCVYCNNWQPLQTPLTLDSLEQLIKELADKHQHQP